MGLDIHIDPMVQLVLIMSTPNRVLFFEAQGNQNTGVPRSLISHGVKHAPPLRFQPRSFKRSG
jgi:hypothetical protein